MCVRMAPEKYITGAMLDRTVVLCSKGQDERAVRWVRLTVDVSWLTVLAHFLKIFRNS
jgi:hypothetical protein